MGATTLWASTKSPVQIRAPRLDCRRYRTRSNGRFLMRYLFHADTDANDLRHAGSGPRNDGLSVSPGQLPNAALEGRAVARRRWTLAASSPFPPSPSGASFYMPTLRLCNRRSGTCSAGSRCGFHEPSPGQVASELFRESAFGGRSLLLCSPCSDNPSCRSRGPSHAPMPALPVPFFPGEVPVPARAGLSCKPHSDNRRTGTCSSCRASFSGRF